MDIQEHSTDINRSHENAAQLILEVEDEAVAVAAALAVTLRGRVGALMDGARAGDSWAPISDDAVTGMQALADAVPGIRDVARGTDAEAADSAARADRRAIASVRSLEMRISRARGQWVASVRRGGW